MAQFVVNYHIQFNLNKDNGVVKIQLQDGSRHRLNVNSHEELLIVATLLSKSPIQYDPATSLVTCGPRPVGT
jgi:hypothetical protein